MTLPSTRPRPHALVVAYHFPPDARVGTMRTLRVVVRLVARGYDVTVLTSDPRTYREGTPLDERLLEAVPANVRIVRARAYRGLEALKRSIKGGPASAVTQAEPTPVIEGKVHSKRSLVLRCGDLLDAALAIPDQESAWYASAVMKGCAASRKRMPDVIYSSAPAWTCQVVASTLASILRRPWVADFRDPWSRAPWRDDRFAFAMRAAARLERRVVKGADRIIFVSQANRDEFATHYGPEVASKFHVVPNGCDPREFTDLVRKNQPSDPFVLLHAGSLYAGRTPTQLFGAIARGIRQGLIDRQRFRARFIGAFALPTAEVYQEVRRLDLEDVVAFLPRVPRSESLQAMVDASALLLLQPNHAVAVPAKLYEYLAAGRPILAIASGETAAAAAQSGNAVCVEGNDEAGILRGLLAVIALAAAAPHVPEPELFDGVRRADKIVAVIDEATRRRPNAPIATVEGEQARVRLSRWSRT